MEVVGLSKVFSNGRGIFDLNFGVEPGEVFGILGPNGSGKTTTIRTVLDFIRPTAGRASFFGVDTHHSPEARHNVGFLPGDLALKHRLTGRQWLQFQGELRGGVDGAFRDELGERLAADLDEPLRNLSTGNRRKIGLVNAFMHRPGLVILDEPTAGLDPLVRQEFYQLVEATRADGRAVFLSSHVLPEVERVCDRIAIIKAGSLAIIETVAGLKSRALRQVVIRFAGAPPETVLSGVEGVRELTVKDATVHLVVSGTIDPLIKMLANYDIEDLISHEPTLEDEFLSFYEEDADAEI